MKCVLSYLIIGLLKMMQSLKLESFTHLRRAGIRVLNKGRVWESKASSSFARQQPSYSLKSRDDSPFHSTSLCYQNEALLKIPPQINLTSA